MSEGVLLDFDNENVPVAIEILDASKIFNIPKNSLKNIICFNMNIVVNNDVIKVFIELRVIIHNKEQSESWNALVGNVDNIPIMDTELITI